MGIIFTISFRDWCIQNNRQDLLERWDYKLNNDTPDKIGKGTQKKYFFKCPINKHPSKAFDINKLSSGQTKGRCPYCSSLASKLINLYGPNALEIKWGSKNKEDPWEIPANSHKKFWFKCTENETHPEYLQAASSASKGIGCPYCHNLLTLPEKSLQEAYPDSVELWSENNKKKPSDVLPGSVYNAIWKCPHGHPDYERPVRDQVEALFTRPECSRSIRQSRLERKGTLYIKQTYGLDVLHEYQCTIVPHHPIHKKTMPYDNEVIFPNGKHLIIEVHGQQHYEVCLYTKMHAKHYDISNDECLEQQQFRDQFKKQFALSKGYHYLEIPYTSEKNQIYKNLIDDMFSKITQF